MQTNYIWGKLYSLLKIPNSSIALPSELFLTEEQEKEKDLLTWEKWEERAKKEYPIRFFLSRTIPRYWRRHIWGDYAPLNRFLYWVRSHTYNRYHFLDLRQAKGSNDEYRWGWIDADAQI